MSSPINLLPTRAKTAYYLCLLPILSLLASCGGGDNNVSDIIDQVPTVAPIESVAKTAVPLSYAASIAMASVNGTSYPNVVTSNVCTGYPCVSVITITVQPNTLPIEPDNIGTGGEIVIVGLWSSANQAILTLVFNGFRVGNEFLSMRKVSTIPVSQQNNTTTFAYSNVDIDIETESETSIDLNDTEIQNEYNRLNLGIDMDPEVNVNLDAWVVEAQSGGTPTDFSDDKYLIVGGGQYFEAGPSAVSVLQIGAVGMQIAPDCVLNPKGGNAILQEVRVSSGNRSTWPILGQALIEFQSTCNGTAKVLLGTGSFFLASGDDIDLGFGN